MLKPATRSPVFNDRRRNRLREYRKILGLTQKELAERSGVSRDVIARLDANDRAQPGIETAILLAKALNITVDELLEAPEPA